MGIEVKNSVSDTVTVTNGDTVAEAYEWTSGDGYEIVLTTPQETQRIQLSYVDDTLQVLRTLVGLIA